MKNLTILLFCLISSLAFCQEKFDFDSSQKVQTELNEEFRDKAKSPLTAEDLASFKGLDFYPINAKYFVVAQFKKSEGESAFEMKTSTARRPKYKKYGELNFTLDGQLCKLNLYQNVELIKKAGFQDHLFLPFSDLTSGNETYIGGRYIDMKIPNGDTVVIDFNAAYNPYCAYNHKYSCPIVPLENDLAIEIKAGVKKFHD